MEIKNIKEYNADYHKDGTLVWKKIGEKTGKNSKHLRTKRTYPLIHMGKIITDCDYPIDADVLQQSRELYAQTKEMIPVFLSFDFNLIGGFEQYELAKELGINKIPAKRISKLNNKDQRQFVKSVTNWKLGNKKYAVTAIDGSKIFMSLNHYKKVKHAIFIAKKRKCILEILPDFTFRMRNKNDYIIGSAEKSVKLNTLIKELEDKISMS